MGMSADAYLFFGHCAEYADESWPDPHDDGWEARDIIEKQHGVKIDWHGSDNYPTPFLAIGESRILAWQGYPHRFGNTLPTEGAGWADRLRQAAIDLGIDVAGVQPSWWLASYWG